MCIFLLESGSAAVGDTMSPLPVFLRPDSFVLLLPCTLPRGPSLSIALRAADAAVARSVAAQGAGKVSLCRIVNSDALLLTDFDSHVA